MEGFLKIIEKEKKKNTFISYQRDLQAFCGHFGKARIPLLTKEELREYFSQLSRHTSQNSLNRVISVVRRYYAYRCRRDHLGENPMDEIRASQFYPQGPVLLSEEDLDILLHSEFPGLRGKRDEAILFLLCETGMKASEVVALNREDLIPSENAVLCGAAQKRRRISVSSEVMKRLRDCAVLSEIQNSGEEALFLGNTGKRLTRQGFWKNLKDRALRCGFEHCSPQILRDSFAKKMLSQGKSREELRLLLGTLGDATLRMLEKQKKEIKQWEC
ncbi:MAG: tyrosine-type recombinase/integrase [Clostridia bacterium]|nr:tyrosine-type recombinase/integrase [Clostridia bacterium]